MKCPKGWENCAICNKKEGLWEYMSGETFIDFVKGWKWNEIIFILIALAIGYILLGWIGVILLFFYCKILANTQGGPNLYTAGIPKIEYRDCPLGHKNCQFTARKVWK
jgi:hypothetical protein